VNQLHRLTVRAAQLADVGIVCFGLADAQWAPVQRQTTFSGIRRTPF